MSSSRRQSRPKSGRRSDKADTGDAEDRRWVWPDALPGWLAPMLEPQLQRLHARSLHHGLLVTGAVGSGRNWLCRHLISTLLCQQRPSAADPASNAGTGDATGSATWCGNCPGCTQLGAGSHPDIRVIRSDDAADVVKVDTVRDLCEWLQTTAHYATGKVAWIQHAERMNTNAANALLKTLEEPAPGTLLLLVAENASALPATITSRCQQVRVRPGQTAAMEQWLADKGVANPARALRAAAMAPLQALAMQEDGPRQQRQLVFNTFEAIVLGKASIEKSVAALSEVPKQVTMAAMLGWITDMQRIRQGAGRFCRQLDVAGAGTENADGDVASQRLQSLERASSNVDWPTIFDQVQRLRYSDHSSIRSQTVLEQIFAVIRLNSETSRSNGK